jgi:hypothetical protein
LLRQELSKYQDQIRRFFRNSTCDDITAASSVGSSPPRRHPAGGATSGGTTSASRPHSFISVGSSDPMDLDSDHVRPHSLLSLDSDTADGATTGSEDDPDAGGHGGRGGVGDNIEVRTDCESLLAHLVFFVYQPPFSSLLLCVCAATWVQRSFYKKLFIKLLLNAIIKCTRPKVRLSTVQYSGISEENLVY